MDKRWINLAVIIAVIAVFAFVFFNPFQERISFAEGKKAIERAWTESGILLDASDPFVEMPKLERLDASLESLHEQFQPQPESKDRKALLAYLQIQFKLVEGLKAYNEMSAGLALLDQNLSLSEACERIDSAESTVSGAVFLAKTNKELDELAGSFNEEFPDFQISANFPSPELDSESLALALSGMKSKCIAGGFA